MTQHSAPYLAARGHGCDLDEGVERHLDVGQLRQRLVQEVGQDAAQHGLVGDQHYVLLSGTVTSDNVIVVSGLRMMNLSSSMMTGSSLATRSS